MSQGAKRYRPMRKWSFAQKLQLLSCYLGHESGFLLASKTARERYYIDLFAGPGQGVIDGTNTIVDGSPLIALEAGPPRFTDLYWVEKRRDNVASLRVHGEEHRGRNISIYHGNANREVDRVLAGIPRHAPVFAFLDPEGAELEWHTVTRLAGHKNEQRWKIELLILFPYNMGIVRLMPRDPSKLTQRHAALLDRFMPDPQRWRNLYERRTVRADAFAFRRGMLEEYVTGLRSLGYAHVPPPFLVFTPDNHPLYFLVFATDHEAGLNIMTWCLKHLPDIRLQPGLFPYEQEY